MNNLWTAAVAHFKNDNHYYKSQPFLKDSGLLKALGVLIVVGLSVLTFSYYVYGYHAYFTPINQLAGFVPSWLLEILTVFGDTIVALMIVFIAYRGDQRLLWLGICAAVIAGILTHTLKPLVGALRPGGTLEAGSFYLTGHLLKYSSFPSGHSAGVFTMVGVLAFIHKHWLSRLLLLLLGLIMAFSRVWVGAHWPLDVIAGSTIGLTSVLLGYWIASSLRQGLSVWAQKIFLALFVINSLLAFFHNTGYPEARPLVIAFASWSLINLAWIYRPNRGAVLNK